MIQLFNILARILSSSRTSLTFARSMPSIMSRGTSWERTFRAAKTGSALHTRSWWVSSFDTEPAKLANVIEFLGFFKWRAYRNKSLWSFKRIHSTAARTGTKVSWPGWSSLDSRRIWSFTPFKSNQISKKCPSYLHFPVTAEAGPTLSKWSILSFQPLSSLDLAVTFFLL